MTLVERAPDTYPDAEDVATETQLEIGAVRRSLDALDGEFIEFRPTHEDGGFVTSIFPSARCAVGQWPTAESLADRLVAALDNAADRTDDPEKKNWLKRTAGYFGSAGRDLLVDVAGAAISRGAGFS